MIANEVVIHSRKRADDQTIQAISDVVAAAIMERVDIANANGTEVSLGVAADTARLVIEKYPEAAACIKQNVIERFRRRIEQILDSYDPAVRKVVQMPSKTINTLGFFGFFGILDVLQDGTLNLFGLLS